MTLRQVTREIISLVEQKSGIPVRVSEDPHLPTLASVKIARKGSLPTHLILYKPSPGHPPDYPICFQCAFILRLFSNPPEKRFDLTDSTSGRSAVEKLLTAPNGIAVQYRLRKEQLIELRDQYLGGLLTHLRSVPIGLRVTEWLSTSYPDLDPLQHAHVLKELDINRQSLMDDMKRHTPAFVYRSAQFISAAYALYWSEKYSQPRYFNVYRLSGYEKDARTLLDLYSAAPDDPTSDQALIDSWAGHLNLSSWYTWQPYQPPA